MTPFPCGRCLPCKINKARIWQHRIILELKTNPISCFVTLTYNDDNLPLNDRHDSVLSKKDLQDYLKRLRRRFTHESIRYFAVGEYGDHTGRPHYHLCLFGICELHARQIKDAWHKRGAEIGHVHIGEVNSQSSRYIAGYCIKKLTNKDDPRLYGRVPEFTLSSRRGGGIGIEAVRRVGEQLKKNPHWSEETVLQAFSIGGKPFPLGGYLTKKLAEILGTPEQEFKARLLAYQEELLTEFWDQKDGYYHNLVAKHEQTRRNMESRQKIFKQRRSI